MKGYRLLLKSVLCVLIMSAFIACGGGGSGSADTDTDISEITDYVGTYRGTYETSQSSPDDDEGAWEFTLAADGTMTGVAQSVWEGFDRDVTGSVSVASGSVSVEMSVGDASGGGERATGDVEGGSTFTGDISSAGVVSGTWENSLTGEFGSFVGQKID